MSKTSANAVLQLKEAIREAFDKAMATGLLPEAQAPDFIIEAPANRANGDLATNAAMAGARGIGRAHV